MKATEAKLLDVLRRRHPSLISRSTSGPTAWGERECRQLCDDIIRTGKNDRIPAHFVGSVVYVEKGLYQVSSQSPLLVIDGQQRLTTVTLLIEALARHLGDKEPLDGFSAKKLRNYYLLNALEDGEKRFKLVLSQTDKASLMAILDQQQPPKEHSLRVHENFEFFQKQLSDPEIVEPLCKGLTKLIIVDTAQPRPGQSSGPDLREAQLRRAWNSAKPT